jgi:hypothetical protein
MAVQSVPASRPVTAAGPGDAGLVPDGGAGGVAGGAVAGGVSGFVVAGRGLEGVTVAGPGLGDVGWGVGCAPGGAPLHAARPAITAPAMASRVTSKVFIL